MSDTKNKKRRISQKQLAANRRNALKSTGPKTLKGKRIARLNSLKHGFYASDEILIAEPAGDNLRDFNDLLDQMTRELQPVGPAEKHLVRRFTRYVWRYRSAFNTISELFQLQRLRGRKPTSVFVNMENKIG